MQRRERKGVWKEGVWGARRERGLEGKEGERERKIGRKRGKK